ncbi:MAG: hypothetical protein KA247_05980, partial [Bacteroidetes bacterium]|nr:hypothetical protein [Bacteroidota bacterium]
MKNHLTLAVIIALFQLASAQVFMQTSVSTMLDDNVNNNAEQLKSAVTSLQLNGGYGWSGEDSDVNLFYDGSFVYYSSLLERTNQFHSLNLEYISLFGTEGEHSFSIGTSAGSGLNRDSYTVFDHSVYSLFTNLKFMTNEWMIIKGGYSARSMSFANLSDFSYTEHAVFLHTAFALSATTTAILQTDLGSKFYASTPAGESSTIRKGGLSSLMPSVTQVIGTVKIGQRLTDELGLSLSERYQWNIQKQTRYLSSEYGFISDDELFDDHYGYEGLHSSVSLTALITGSFTVKLSGGIQNKLYSTLPAYDLEGTYIADQRIDSRSYLNLKGKRNFTDYGFSLTAAFDIIKNSSNDAYYEY